MTFLTNSMAEASFSQKLKITLVITIIASLFLLCVYNFFERPLIVDIGYTIVHEYSNDNRRNRTKLLNPALTYNKTQYLDKFKNPCFYDSSGVLQCLPYALNIGMPKCGSTDLFGMMTKHPDIENTRKEIHWWSRTRFQTVDGKVTARPLEKYYTHHYSRASQNIEKHPQNIIVDPSPSTMWDNDYWSKEVDYSVYPDAEPDVTTADYIKHILPDAKFIVIVRNPVTRLFSDYKYFNRNKGKSSTDFHRLSVEAVTAMTECINNHGERSCVYNQHFNNQLLELRLRIGMYTISLEDWLKVFDRDRFFIIQMEEYANNRYGILDQLCTFLNIGKYSEKTLTMINATSAVNRNSRTRVKMLPETERLLTRFYQPYNDRLAELLHNSKFKWT